jgi:hypothetical protein
MAKKGETGPTKPIQFKKVAVGVKLKGWLVEKLRASEKSHATMIEDALVKTYGWEMQMQTRPELLATQKGESRPKRSRRGPTRPEESKGVLLGVKLTQWIVERLRASEKTYETLIERALVKTYGWQEEAAASQTSHQKRRAGGALGSLRASHARTGGRSRKTPEQAELVL